MSKKKKSLSIFALLFVFAASFALVIQQGEKTEKINFKVNDDYAKYWKQIDSLENKGLSQSALDIVTQIYADAKIKNNSSAFIKAFMYKMKFTAFIEEDSHEKMIAELQKESEVAVYPIKPILHSMLAEMYWQYYQNNRYRFYKRSTTVNFDETDIKTWDLKKIIAEVIHQYQNSLQEEDKLKNTSLNIYDEVLLYNYAPSLKLPESRKLRPSLFDFVAHRAIDFYNDEEPDITSPVYQFNLNSENYFLPAKEFCNVKIENKDSLSLKYYAILNLQKLIAFHLNDTNPSASIDVDLERLKFVRMHSGLTQKDSLYLNALLSLEKKYNQDFASANVSFLIATYYYEQGNTFNAQNNTKYQWHKKKALEVCESTIQKFKDTQGAKNCEVLKQSILKKYFSFQTEEVNAPNKAFRTILTHQNADSLFIKVAAVDVDKYKSLMKTYNTDEVMNYYNSLSPTKSWAVKIKNEGDYQMHLVEIKMPELVSGLYVILASTDKKFKNEKDAIAYSATWVSDIAYINRYNDKTGVYDFYTLNREDGSPLVAVKSQIWYDQYNYKNRAYDHIKGAFFTSDAEGHFTIPPSKGNNYRNFEIEFTSQNQKLFSKSFYQYQPYAQKQTAYVQTFFFTDRAIYRPGQTIYFKGIILDRNGDQNSIKPNFSTTVQLLDVNYQKVSEQTFTTNDYGSFSGSFTAPSGVLTGQMQIKNESGSMYISVEEYKRPKFEVSFNPIKGSYKLDEDVKVTGLAKAFSGALLTDAQVKYRVVRNASYPYWCWWRGAYPSSPEMEISNGNATTNEKGEFDITFKALPDLSITKTQKPIYTYTIYADVTDLNGETHSAEQSVSVSYQALKVSTDIAAFLNKDKQQDCKITTTNLNGEAEAAEGNIAVYKISVPEKTFRSRLWKLPDQMMLSKDEYYTAFPFDEYNNENQMQNWAKEKKVLDQIFNTAQSTKLDLKDIAKWTSGVYKYEITTKDKFGEVITLENYFTVFSTADKAIPDNSTNWFVCTKDNGEPGENAEFVIGSKENIKVLYEVEKKGEIVNKQWLTLNNEQKKISIPIEEKDRGGFVIHYTFIKHNRQYTESQNINVPFTNKELDIRFETFRNKLQPGAKEEWKIKIKGKNGDKIAAEMLATLYDASLDEFKVNAFNFNILNNYYTTLSNYSGQDFSYNNSNIYKKYNDPYYGYTYNTYEQLNWYGYSYYGSYGGRNYYSGGGPKTASKKYKDDVSNGIETMAEEAPMKTLEIGNGDDFNAFKGNVFSTTKGSVDAGGDGKDHEAKSEPKIRTNFNETAFFYPQLQTNENGEVIIAFTIPEALTKWKMLGFAHTKDLRYGFTTNELVTQKELMVVPNAPRFFRENDKIEFTAKISNLTDSDLKGNCNLQLFDALTMKPITPSPLGEGRGEGLFSVPKNGNTNVSWWLSIPDNVQAIAYRITATSGNFSDGEEMTIPVLTNRMLVTESMPLPIRGNQTKTFTFEKLLNSSSPSGRSGGVNTLKNHNLTLEFTSNPAWYAVQALPYLMEYPYECAEQTFSRYYANSLATHIANSDPKIKQVFDSWKNYDQNALLSNLEKNEDLKTVLLQETPWVLDAKNESERKKRIALLFDLNKMSNELNTAFKKLQQMQAPNGGWPWFKGMPDDRYITQHIVCGFGHLDKLGVKNIRENNSTWSMIQDAVLYLDNRMREDYENLKKYKVDLKNNNLSQIDIHYLYTRSYFTDIAVVSKNKEAYNYYLDQANKYWLSNARYLQGMTALALYRLQSDSKTPVDIIKSLKENALHSDEMGMYWKEFNGGYYWYEAPIESQALMIEAFNEVAKDKQAVDELRIWLLKQKQTQDWKTTKATAEACYSLLLTGTNWLATEPNVTIQLGEVKIDPANDKNIKTEAGTGYFKTSWNSSAIKPEMGNITVTKTGDGVGWGAVYWQYFEQLDKITPHETPLKLEKKLFLEQTTDAGNVLTPIDEKTKLKPGDRVKVRIELRVDRMMEYVHMKDMRASCFEPENVLSQYKYQDGLGYYESTLDVSTNFFFSYLPKGTYVFEYPLLVTHKGDFSNGITNIECMYAPEFGAHSEGIRVQVK